LSGSSLMHSKPRRSSCWQSNETFEVPDASEGWTIGEQPSYGNG
jgi:hypothetical protein